MTFWTSDSTPGHAGYLVALTPRADVGRVAMQVLIGDDEWRPLGSADVDHEGAYLRVVQVGCTCGWRSSRVEAPISARWWPQGIDVADWFDEQMRKLWVSHARATVFTQHETDRLMRIAGAESPFSQGEE
jgi:hypothetical protein